MNTSSMDVDANTRQPSYPTRFPGFGYPVNYGPVEDWFPGSTEKRSLLLYTAVNDYRMQYVFRTHSIQNLTTLLCAS